MYVSEKKATMGLESSFIGSAQIPVMCIDTFRDGMWIEGASQCTMPRLDLQSYQF